MVLVAVGIASVEARTAFYARIATRIWENNPYPPQTILDALAESSKVSPTLACASGSVVDRAAIALRALDDAIAGHSDLAASSAFPIATQAIDDGLACRPLAAQLWLGGFGSARCPKVFDRLCVTRSIDQLPLHLMTAG